MAHDQADGVRVQPWQVPRPREGRAGVHGLGFLDGADGTPLASPAEVFVTARWLTAHSSEWMTVTAADPEAGVHGLLLVPAIPEQETPVRRRAVYDTAFTDRPLARARTRERTAAGEQARVRKGTSGVNLLIADGSALVSVHPVTGILYQDADTVTRIRAWFETLWEESAPFGRPDLPPPQDLVLNLLADGYQPAGIARELGISTAEARRHVRVLLRRLGARTMIQAGALSYTLGWVD